MQSKGLCVPGVPATHCFSHGNHIRNSPKPWSDPALGKIFFTFYKKLGSTIWDSAFQLFLLFFSLCTFPFIDSFCALVKLKIDILFCLYKAQFQNAHHLISRYNRQGSININAYLWKMSLSSVFESLNQEHLWNMISLLKHTEHLTGGSFRSRNAGVISADVPWDREA